MKKLIHNPDLEKKTNVKDLLTQARSRVRKSKKYGHVSYARDTLMSLKREVGSKEFRTLGPTTVFNFILLKLEKDNPALLRTVEKEVGLKRYKREVFRQYYTVRDEE